MEPEGWKEHLNFVGYLKEAACILVVLISFLGACLWVHFLFVCQCECLELRRSLSFSMLTHPDALELNKSC